MLKDLPVVFDVVDQQSPIMHDFAKSSDVVDVLLAAAVQFGDQHAQHWSPSFAASVQQVPDGLAESLGEAYQMVVALAETEVFTD